MTNPATASTDSSGPPSFAENMSTILRGAARLSCQVIELKLLKHIAERVNSRALKILTHSFYGFWLVGSLFDVACLSIEVTKRKQSSDPISIPIISRAIYLLSLVRIVMMFFLVGIASATLVLPSAASASLLASIALYLRFILFIISSIATSVTFWKTLVNPSTELQKNPFYCLLLVLPLNLLILQNWQAFTTFLTNPNLLVSR